VYLRAPLSPVLRLFGDSHPVPGPSGRAGRWAATGRAPDVGVCLQQHGNPVRSRVELRQREPDLRAPRAWRSQRVLRVRARASRLRVGPELWLRSRRSVPVRHVRGRGAERDLVRLRAVRV